MCTDSVSDLGQLPDCKPDVLYSTCMSVCVCVCVCVCVLILCQIWAYFLTVSLVFFVTLACFPAIVSLIRSVDYRPGDPWTGE